MPVDGRLSYARWLLWIMGGEEAPSGWDEEADPVAALVYATRLFETAAQWAPTWSDDQVAKGLHTVVSTAGTCHLGGLMNEGLPVSLRQACVASMYPLYRDLFNERCVLDASGHHGECLRQGWRTQIGGGWTLAQVCTMWWELVPLFAQPARVAQREIDVAALDVMDRTLQLDSALCQVGALHGLGHWALGYPEHVAAVIDRFLESAACDAPVRRYAADAKAGRVL